WGRVDRPPRAIRTVWSGRERPPRSVETILHCHQGGLGNQPVEQPAVVAAVDQADREQRAEEREEPRDVEPGHPHTELRDGGGSNRDHRGPPAAEHPGAALILL